jgi:hypothetical protein
MEVSHMGGRAMPENLKKMNKILEWAGDLDDVDFQYVINKMEAMKEEREGPPSRFASEAPDATGTFPD